MKYWFVPLLLGGSLFAQINNGGGSLPTGTVAPAIYQTGLLAQYDFNQGSGTTLTDVSGNGNNGTFCASAPTWISQASGGGLTFNGTSNCITLPAALNSARTIFLVTQQSLTSGSAEASPLGSNGGQAGSNGIIFNNAQNVFTQGCNAASSLQAAGSQGGNIIMENAATCGIFSNQFSAGLNLFAVQKGSAGDSTHDLLWAWDTLYPYGPVNPSNVANVSSGGQSSGQPSAGVYQFGGSAAGGLLTSFATWYGGQIYYAVFYSGFLTAQQVAQNFQAIQSVLQQRGLQLTHVITGAISSLNINMVIGLGDSITYGTGLTTNYLQYLTIAGNMLSTGTGKWRYADLGLPTAKAADQTGEGITNTADSWANSNGAWNIFPYWLGTNDCVLSGTSAADTIQYIGNSVRRYRAHFADPTHSKIIGITMISRTGTGDACKDALNPVIRQNWRGIFDGFADVAADPNLGADGASANTTYFQGDAVHPTTHGQANDIAPIVQRSINRIIGNNDWQTANVYTATAAAATATTAGSESGNTITLTFGATPANCNVGNTITVAGTTPAGYSGNWTIQTRTATQVTYWSNTTALGAITVQGTGVCASQQDVDVYVRLGGSATTPSFTLESCQGYTGQNLYIKNENTTSPWTITPFTSSETIDGATSLAMPAASSGNNPVVILQAQLVSDSAGGCVWKRRQ